MKKIKRIKLAFLIIPFVFAAAMLPACNGEEVNQGPELRGVNDISCLAETSVDLLSTVAALDEEDGDITPEIQITVTPHVDVTDGYATFKEVGDYEVCYEVRDSGGKFARTTAYASVVEREDYNFALLSNGFSASAGGGAKITSQGISGDKFSFKATGGVIAEDISLSRRYSIYYDTEYTFNYIFTSNLKGKIYLAANGEKFGETAVSAGENTLTFKYAVQKPAHSTENAANVEIQLWLGSLEGELEVSLQKAEVVYTEESTGLTERLPDFNFNGKIIDRFDNDGGNLTLNASSKIVDDGKGVKLNVTETTSPDIWRGGVFVNTGLPLSEGVTYHVSFDLSSENGNPYEVLLLRSQWGPDECIATVSGGDGRKEAALTIDGGHTGNLWVYIQSGNNVNGITLKNLSVKSEAGGEKRESYAIGGFTCGGGEVESEYGKVVYTVSNFGNDWGNNELGSPTFKLSGAAENFVIQFRAKASKRVNTVFAATLAANWDTFVWKNFFITTEEQLFSIRCDKKALEGVYKLVWQFGNSANASPDEVNIEIRDIRICLKNELDD